MPEGNMTATQSGIEVKRLAGALGAEIKGLDLADGNYDNLFPALYQAFLDHQVIVLRGQNLTPDQLVALSKKFGPLEAHVLKQFNMVENPEVLLISNVKKEGKPIGAIYAGQYWHSDLSYMKRPTQGSFLHSKEIPSYGGDTMFCSMTQAYDDLSEPMKAFLGGLTATHDYTNVYDTFFAHLPDRPPLTAEEKAKVLPVTHPVIRSHPETGKKAIYVNPGFTRRINELSFAESRRVLDFLFEHCQQPQYIYRHMWGVGDLVIWDNRSTCHRAVADYDMSENRHMIRCAVAGDIPQ